MIHVSRRSHAARIAAVYGWRTSGTPGVTSVLERVGHSRWVPELLLQLFTLAAVTLVAASWLVPAITVGVTLGWDTTIEAGPARAVNLSGPAWMYGLFGLVFVAIAVGGLPYIVRETRRHRLPAPVLTLTPEYLSVHTRRDVRHGTGVRKPRVREVFTMFEWRDVVHVEASHDPDDARPTLIVRRSAAEHLGVLSAPAAPGAPLGTGDEVAIRIRGDDRDVPVLEYFLAKRRQRRQLGTEDSLQLAQRLSASG